MSIIAKIGNKGMFVTSIFYAAVGIIFLVLLPSTDFAPHIALLGVFSLVTAYGLLRKRAWSFWLVLILFVSGTTFALFMIYDALVNAFLIAIGMIAYLILTWVSTGYAALKRNTLES
jgi:hypothetical protein